eukprot:SAG11_NODE_5229_length_1622_cov_2.067630_2_plen_83_part_00
MYKKGDSRHLVHRIRVIDVWRTGPHEASVVPLPLAMQGFRDGQWQLADLTHEGALRRQKATAVPTGRDCTSVRSYHFYDRDA